MFYNNDIVQREGMLPKRIVNTLFGKGAIHTIDGKKHIDRKALFMSLMTGKPELRTRINTYIMAGKYSAYGKHG